MKIHRSKDFDKEAMIENNIKKQKLFYKRRKADKRLYIDNCLEDCKKILQQRPIRKHLLSGNRSLLLYRVQK